MAKQRQQRKPRNMFAYALIVQKRGKIQNDRRDRRSGEPVDYMSEGYDDDPSVFLGEEW